MKDRFESGFDADRNSIYVDGKLVNQYEGVSDLHLAYKLAEYLGIDWQRATAHAISVQAFRTRVPKSGESGYIEFD